MLRAVSIVSKVSNITYVAKIASTCVILGQRPSQTSTASYDTH